MMPVLLTLAALSFAGIVLTGWIAFKLGRASRPTTTLSAAPMDSETKLYVGSEVWPPDLSRLDNGMARIELGRKQEPTAQEETGWKQMPPRDPDGKFLKKPLS